MKALVLTGKRQIEMQDLPVPEPGPRQVLVRHQVSAVSTGSEVIRYLNGAGPDIGYLGAGIVEKVGDSLQDVQPGDRVRTHGPHHEYVLLDSERVIKIPSGVDFEQAAYAYLPTLGLHALRLCNHRLGENACFIGQGVVGLMGSAMCKALGVRVIALDIEENRLSIARLMGIRDVLNPSAFNFDERLHAIVGEKGVDISVDATGSYHGLVQALNLTRKWGRIAILGMYRPDPPNPEMAAQLHEAYINNVHRKELQIIGCSNDPFEVYPAHIWRFSFWDNVRLSLELLDRQEYDLKPAITHRLEPKEGLTLYERLGKREPGMLGIIFRWGVQ